MRSLADAFRRYRLVVVAFVVTLLACPASFAAGICLEQKPLPAGCLTTGGSLGCTSIATVDGGYLLTITSDGESVYMSTFVNDIVATFDRNTATGTLAQVPGPAGCVSDSGTGGACTDARNLASPSNVAVSAGLTSAYIGTAGGIGVFDRNTSSGVLTQKAARPGASTTPGPRAARSATRSPACPWSLWDPAMRRSMRRSRRPTASSCSIGTPSPVSSRRKRAPPDA